MSCNNLTNFEYEEAFAKPKLLKFGKKKGQLIQLDDATRIDELAICLLS